MSRRVTAMVLLLAGVLITGPLVLAIMSWLEIVQGGITDDEWITLGKIGDSLGGPLTGGALLVASLTLWYEIQSSAEARRETQEQLAETRRLARAQLVSRQIELLRDSRESERERLDQSGIPRSTFASRMLSEQCLTKLLHLWVLFEDDCDESQLRERARQLFADPDVRERWEELRNRDEFRLLTGNVNQFRAIVEDAYQERPRP